MYSASQSSRKMSSNALDGVFQSATLMDDYQQDKDYILETIASALKTRDFETAIAFVNRYRSVAASDPKFRIVAEKTDAVAKDYAKQHTLLLQLDATPDHEYDTRIKIYRALIACNAPKAPEYQKALDTCLERQKEQTADDETRDVNSEELAFSNRAIQKKDKTIYGCRKHDITLMKLFVLFSCLVLCLVGAMTHVSGLLLLIILGAGVLVCYKLSHLTKAKTYPGTFVVQQKPPFIAITYFIGTLGIMGLILMIAQLFAG